MAARPHAESLTTLYLLQPGEVVQVDIVEAIVGKAESPS